jgi:glycine cleavage system H protein
LQIAGLVALISISVMLPLACRGGATRVTVTVNPTTGTSIQNTTPTSATSPGKTTTFTPTTSTNIANPVNTGTDDQFTVSWVRPSSTSTPYLTFYNSLKYTNDCFWVKQEPGNIARIGFTDYAQQAMGNFWSLDFSKPGTVLKRGDTFGFAQGEDTMDVNIESPVSGTLLTVNPDVLADYRLITLYPYDAGWLVTIQMNNPDDLKLLLTAAQYVQNCYPPCHCNN